MPILIIPYWDSNQSPIRKCEVYRLEKLNDIQKAVRLLNNRPRKRLNYLTPYEVFNEK